MVKDIKEFDGCDIYSIEEEDGKKQVHVHGYMFAQDGYHSSEQCWMIYPLDEFIERVKNEGSDFVSEEYCEYKEYEHDFDTEEEYLDAFNHYCNGKEPKPLAYEELTMDTPCGCYYDKNSVYLKYNGEKYAWCTIEFKDDPCGAYDTYIKLDTKDDNKDVRICYYCNSVDELINLTNKDNGEDFYVKEIIEFTNEIN